MSEGGIDERGYANLIRHIAGAGVESICALGSTGNYAYLDRAERARAIRLAVAHAGTVPVMAGIGALRTRDVLALADDAQEAGASALLLAPMAYHRLVPEEVHALFDTVARHVAVPLCVYDNPETTRFAFSDALHGVIARLPNVRSLKIPPVSASPHAVRARIDALRASLPADTSIGISGDSQAAVGLLGGCDVWYSVIGGIFPATAAAIVRAARQGNAGEALRLSARLEPLWELFGKYHGSLRVVAAAASILGFTTPPSLPLPLQPISEADRSFLADLIDKLELA
jgi:4-hydroxy-tetrahydrodipicolinate synthase